MGLSVVSLEALAPFVLLELLKLLLITNKFNDYFVNCERFVAIRENRCHVRRRI